MGGFKRPRFLRGVIDRNHRRLVVAWQIFDLGAVLLSLALAALILSEPLDKTFWQLGGIVAVVMFITYSFADIYYRRRTRNYLDDVHVLLAAWTKTVLWTLAIAYLVAIADDFSRLLYLWWGFIGFTAQLFVHLGVQSLLRGLRRRGFNTRYALLVGRDASVGQFARFLNENQWVGVKPMGYVSDTEPDPAATDPTDGAGDDLPNLGPMAEIGRILKDHQIREIYILLPMERGARLEPLLKQLLNFPVDVNWIPELSVVDAMSTRVDTVVETPVIRLTDSSLRGGKHALKRLTDVLASSLLIVLLAPVMAVIALMVKRSSPGPVLFKQKRRGIDGATIKVWKFRTMWQHPEGDQARQAVENDDRVTPLGAVLRRWSLDELPQLFNVLQGKMSLVGPRPHALWMDDQFEDEIDLYRQRHKVKPGITGWAQIHGFRGGTETLDKMEARVKHDLYYINHWSLWLDVKILLKTLPAILSRQNAY